VDTDADLPADGDAVRAPSTEALSRLEEELAELEAELAALEADDGTGGRPGGSAA
jgi:hypothetical protein